jgi:hypothetical protein
MDPSASSQYSAICYRQSSARLGHAFAKAAVMHILGVPRLPLQQSIPSALLALNCPGPADQLLSPTLPPLAYPHPLHSPPLPSPLPLLYNALLLLDARLSFPLCALLASALFL